MANKEQNKTKNAKKEPLHASIKDKRKAKQAKKDSKGKI